MARLGMYLAAFVAVANVSVIYLALPGIEDALHVSIADQQWLVSIYPLMEGGFALAAGTIGDLYGRKRVLAISVAIFLLSSLVCALAPDPATLIAARALQGIGSAGMLSLPIAILVQMLPDPKENGDTIKSFTLIVGIAAGATPLIAGAIVQWFSWPGIFIFSAILAAVALFCMTAVGENTCEPGRKLDIAGQSLSILALLALSFIVIQGEALEAAPTAWFAALGIVVVALSLFLVVERHAQQPMVHIRMFDRPRFYVSLLVLGIVNFGWYGLMLVCTLFLQRVMLESALMVGLLLTPCNIAFFAANAYSSRLAQRLGIRVTILTSFALSLAGMAWIAILPATARPFELAMTLVLAGAGWGLICTPATSLGMSAVQISDEGFASAMLVLARTLLGVFGVAVLGTLLESGLTIRVDNARLGPHVTAAAHAGQIFALLTSPAYGVDLSPVIRFIDDAFAASMHDVAWVCFALTIAFGAISIFALGSDRRRRSDPDLPVV